MDVGNVALVAAAQLDAERRRQNEAGETGGRTHHHFCRDPAPEARPDQNRVLKPKFGGKIEIEIGEVADTARSVIHQG